MIIPGCKESQLICNKAEEAYNIRVPVCFDGEEYASLSWCAPATSATDKNALYCKFTLYFHLKVWSPELYLIGSPLLSMWAQSGHWGGWVLALLTGHCNLALVDGYAAATTACLQLQFCPFRLECWTGGNS